MSEPGRTDPPITDEMRERAKQNPDGWLYIVDPGYEGNEGDVPPEGVIGAFQIDSNGELLEEFHHNDQYEPSPMAQATPDPTNDLERLLNRIVAGEAEDAELPPAVLAAEILIYSPSEDDGSVYAAELTDGSQIVPACTSAGRVPDDWPGFRVVPGHALPQILGGLDLGLNLHEGVQVIVPNQVLVETAEALSDSGQNNEN